MLFDLRSDMSESDDLSASNPDLVRKLDQQLRAYLQSVDAKLPTKRLAGAPATYDNAERSGRGGRRRGKRRLDRDQPRNRTKQRAEP